jgi:predicted short-subunit dehydrogenase-like oxidoreductase (DUF2520 family)
MKSDMETPRDIVLLGAGNLASTLGPRLRASAARVLQVFSRSETKANALAAALEAQPIQDLTRVAPGADLYLLAVRDDAIAPVANALARHLPPGSLLAHTSGATPLSALSAYFARHAVLYPLQTFSAGREIDFESIPICVQAARSEDAEALLALARRLSRRVLLANDEQRATLHLAAVFVNNFVNHLFGIGEHLLHEKGLSFELLLPLIEETIAKARTMPPAAAQTGPARRDDRGAMTRHLEMLGAHPRYQTLYRLLSESIQKAE